MSDERSVPYYCPYCGEEDLYPHADTSPAHPRPARDAHGAWECHSCRRVFTVSLRGLLAGTTAPDTEPDAG